MSLRDLQREAHGKVLRSLAADNDDPIRKVAITVFVNSDASCTEIARSMHAILEDAGVTGYELGVAPVESK